MSLRSARLYAFSLLASVVCTAGILGKWVKRCW